MRDRRGVDPDGRGGVGELGRVEGRETLIRIHYVRKRFIFNRKVSSLKKQNECLH